MDKRISKEKKENETIDYNEIFDQDNEDEDIYCSKCLKIPKYTIIIDNNKKYSIKP